MKKNTARVLSFLSGIALASVVVGVTIVKSPALRNEIESQLSSILKTTRTLVDSYKGIASKSKTAAHLIHNDPDEKTMSEVSEAQEQTARINNQWDAIETHAL